MNVHEKVESKVSNDLPFMPRTNAVLPVKGTIFDSSTKILTLRSRNNFQISPITGDRFSIATLHTNDSSIQFQKHKTHFLKKKKNNWLG